MPQGVLGLFHHAGGTHLKKRIPLIIILSLIIAALGAIIYSIVVAASEYDYPEIKIEDRISPYSRKLMFRFLEKMGYQVKLMRIPYNREDYAIVIHDYQDAKTLTEWRTWVKKGRRLVVLGQTPRQGEQEFSPASGPPFFEGVERLFLHPDRGLDSEMLADGYQEPEILLADGWRNLIVRQTIDGGEIIYLSDEAMFNDNLLIKGDNAVFLNNCVREYFGQTIIFDNLPLDTSPKKDKPAESYFLFRGIFLALFLQLVLLGLVFLLVFWKRFGPVLDREQFAKRSLMHHLEAAGCFFEKSKSPNVFIRILDRYFFSRLHELMRFHSGQQTDVIAEAKKRIPPDPHEETIFIADSSLRIVERDCLRERYILRLEGVESRPWKKQKHLKISSPFMKK